MEAKLIIEPKGDQAVFVTHLLPSYRVSYLAISRSGRYIAYRYDPDNTVAPWSESSIPMVMYSRSRHCNMQGGEQAEYNTGRMDADQGLK